jgi:hypothetical protein
MGTVSRKGGWHRRGIILAALLTAAGVVAGSIYFGYQNFVSETHGYLGVTFEDNKNVVSYRLGFPVYVPGEPERHEGYVLAPMLKVGGFDDDGTYVPGEIPEDKKIVDYDEWYYEIDRRVSFEPKSGRVIEIGCSTQKVKPDYSECPPLLGISLGDTESYVISQLGEPTKQEVPGLIKTLRYDDLGVEFTLKQERVTGIRSFTPKGSTSAFVQRYLKTWVAKVIP